MELVASYVKSIAYFMIFTAFIEVIAPSGSFKKYVRLIMSLMLIGLVVSPISNLLRSFNIERNLSRIENQLDKSIIASELRTAEYAQAQAVITEYKERLSKQAAELLKTQTGLTEVHLEFIVNDDYESDNFAEILGVHITAESAGSSDSPVKTAMLGNATVYDGDMQFKIKNCITSFYNIPEGNIHITVQDE